MTDGGDEPRRRDDGAGISTESSTEPAPAGEKTPNERADTRHSDGSETDETGDEAYTTPEAIDGPVTTAGEPMLAEPTTSRVRPVPRGGLDKKTIAEYTTDRRSLDPTVQIQWSIRTAIGAVILGLIAGAILGSFNIAPQFGSIAVGVFLVVGLIWVVLRYRVWVYQIREDSVYLERGVLTHVRTIVPYVRIQHVDTSRSPLERALGLSTLVVYTAGSRGADVSIPGLKPEEARDLQQRLKELAIEAEGDDAL